MHKKIWKDNDVKLRKNIIRFSVLLTILFVVFFKAIFDLWL